MIEGVALIPLFFLGEANDKRIPKAFRRAAAEHLECGFIFHDNVFWKESASIVCVECDDAQKIAGGGVVILKDNFNLDSDNFSSECICIVNSQNVKAVEFAAKANLKSISCGSSAYDTLTFSSLTPEKAVISLQRQIILPNETNPAEQICVEPADYILNLKTNPELYTILAVAAGFIFSGYGEVLSDVVI